MNTVFEKKDTAQVGQPKPKRNVNLDITRSLAVFLVMTVHFLLNTEFYGFVAEGKRYFLLIVIRTFSIICVALFMLLTGYLMNKKTLCASYYKGIIRILVIYLIACAASTAYKCTLGIQEFDLYTFITNITNFSAARYSWYVEMYIGLFLLIPFLNLIYNGLDTKRKKNVLLATFFIITCLPTILNIFRFDSIEWFLHPSADRAYVNLVPNWWANIYPITLYFVGCYLKEYPIRINKWLNMSLIFICTAAFSVFNFYRNYGQIFVTEIYTEYQSFEVLVLSVLVFVLILGLDTTKMSNKISAVFKYISNISFSMYLLSEIPDYFIYRQVNMVARGLDRAKFIIIAVPLVFICSVILGSITELVYRGIMKIFSTVKGIKVCSSKK